MGELRLKHCLKNLSIKLNHFYKRVYKKSDRHVGLSIANISLEVEDSRIVEFIKSMLPRILLKKMLIL